MQVFYEHDSDNKLIAKKNALELNNWIQHLVSTGEELELLVNIAKKLPEAQDMVTSLKELALDNKLQLAVLYRYKNSMVNIHECEDMECDTYYVNKHEEYRAEYCSILHTFSKIKIDLYNMILLLI